jgi:SAM-dependent methyltransferase
MTHHQGATSLAYDRRQRDPRFRDRYFVGDAIDIGAGPDPLGGRIGRTWPNLRSVRDWDLKDGDAVFMHGLDGQRFDLVYSSHCLEHVSSPLNALNRWWQLVKPGGHLVLVVPDEDLYEQGVWPPTMNSDHKSTWTLFKRESWSPASINLLPQLMALPGARIVKVEWIEEGFDYSLERCDQTGRGNAECSIECILRKELT